MKIFRLIPLACALVALPVAAPAQTPPAPTTGAPAPAKKPFSTGDAKVLLAIADSMQFQLKMSELMSGKFRESNPTLAAFAGPIRQETTALWTPTVDMATAGGVEGKKIPLDMSKTDRANLTKLNVIKDEKKWTLAYFEFYAKESKKNARDAEAGVKTLADAGLKEWGAKAEALLKSQAERIEAKYKELKSAKK